jgi:hypothetical protein
MPGRPCIVLFDLNRFKAVNDTHGHAAGDRVLREAGEALAGTCRSSDLAFRVGGDEFTYILPESDHDAAMAAAGRAFVNFRAAGPLLRHHRVAERRPRAVQAPGDRRRAALRDEARASRRRPGAHPRGTGMRPSVSRTSSRASGYPIEGSMPHRSQGRPFIRTNVRPEDCVAVAR